MNTTTAPACPVCGLENTYPDGTNWICPDCTHEWPMAADADTEAEADTVVRDSNGTGDHEVDCKTDQGAFMLKAEFLKKA